MKTEDLEERVYQQDDRLHALRARVLYLEDRVAELMRRIETLETRATRSESNTP